MSLASSIISPAGSASTPPPGTPPKETTPSHSSLSTFGLMTTTSSPIQIIKLFNRLTLNSPLSPNVRSAPRSPFASPHTEPRLRTRNTAISPVAASSVAAGLLSALKSSADSGDANAQFNLAMSYSFGEGVQQNYEEALSWFLKCAEKGDAQAKYYLGIMYLHGYGTKIDIDKAFNLFHESAYHGDVAAQCDLGVMYFNGQGVVKNEEVAVNYFRKAAQQGNSDAQLNLAYSYLNGEGIEKDKQQAIIWFRKAAEQGDVDAQIQLDSFFMDDLGTDKEKTEAVFWYQQAAAKNLKFAQKALITAFSIGQGVKQNLKIATYWLMNYGLNKVNAISIAEEYFHLIEFIPSVFRDFPEFGNITKLEFKGAYLNSENIKSISELIRLDMPIGLLNLTGISLDNSDGLAILQSLKENTKLTDFFYDNSLISENIIKEIQAYLTQNIAIGELKQYLSNHILLRSTIFSSDAISNAAEKLIISLVKSGQGLGNTKSAVDNFLKQSALSMVNKNS